MGEDFLAPFSIANVNYCAGDVTELPGVEPIDYWVVAIDKVEDASDEFNGDRTLFLTHDFAKFNVLAEILADD